MALSRTLLISLLLKSIITPGQDRVETSQNLVPVTAKFSAARKNSKHHNYRFQVIRNSTGSHLLGFGLSRLPRSLKSLRFDEQSNRLRRNQMEASASSGLDSVYNFLNNPGQELSFKIPSPKEFARQKRLFLSGKNSSLYFSNQWVRLATLSDHSESAAKFRTRGFLKTHHTYTTSMLPGAMAWELPALDPWNCQPAELRFFKLRKLEGYGISRIRYLPYDQVSRVILRESFEVYFPKNETTPEKGGISKVISFLDQNNYVILHAALEGGCSVEGASERNLFLQKQRARILRQILHRYSDDLLKKDTVMLSNVFEQFREVIKGSPYEWIGALGNDSIQLIVNSNKDLREKLEPYLTLQRKATLKLVLAKRLTHDDQLKQLVKDLNRFCDKILRTDARKTEAEGRLAGMIGHVFGYYLSGNISYEELENMLSETSTPDYLRVLLGYHLLKEFEKNSITAEASATWKAYWDKFNVYQIIKKGESAALALSLKFTGTERSRFIKMLTDFQAYKYQFVEMQLIDPNDLCDIPYPELPQYMGLILNQYAYLYEISAGNILVNNERVHIRCIPDSSQKNFRKDSVANTDRFIDDLTIRYGRSYSLIGNKLIRKKNFDNSQKGAYYYLLKQHYLKNNRSVLKQVQFENDNSEVRLNVFNLWHLVTVNIRNWDPYENYFYDEEVQIDEMDLLVSQLKKMDRIFCRPVVNDLYLSFHLKMLYYLGQYAEPGNPKHTRYADASLKFITNYYKARARWVNSRLALHIIKQMNLFNLLPGSKTGAWYGYDLLNSIAKERLLNEEELKIYSHYLKLFNPRLKKIPSLTIERQSVLAYWNEEF